MLNTEKLFHLTKNVRKEYGEKGIPKGLSFVDLVRNHAKALELSEEYVSAVCSRLGQHGGETKKSAPERTEAKEVSEMLAKDRKKKMRLTEYRQNSFPIWEMHH
ncbi:MAG: hypothetical protein ACE5F2_01790 [Candidatus Paceibacteria bacterium]